MNARRFNKPVSESVRAWRANSRWMDSCSITMRISPVTEVASLRSSPSHARLPAGRQATSPACSPNRVEAGQASTV